MKIINLQVENYKKVKAVEINPDGSLVILAGRTAQGKTSVIDAIWAALEGGDVSRVTKQPIREGESQASVRIDLGEYIVTRKWTKDGVGNLTVASPRGAEYGSPQKILDGLVGKMSMDPLAFTKQRPAEQIATLVAMLGDKLGFDPIKLEARRSEAFEARAHENREVVRLTALVEAFPDFPIETPRSLVSGAALIEEYSMAQAANLARQNAIKDVESLTAEIEEENRRHAQFLDAMSAELVTARDKSMKLGHVDVNLTEINDRILALDATNQVIHRYLAKLDVQDLLDVAEVEAKRHDDTLTAIKVEKATGLAAVVFPDPLMSFDDDGVTYNGLPFAQASGREKITASLAVAMAMNPELRVIRIDQGEALDKAGLKHIAALAAQNDYQIWMSRVDESGTAGVIIEDGMVKA